MRLIDADKVKFYGQTFSYGLNRRVCPDLCAQDVIDEQPTIDPVHAAGACYCGECKRWKKADCPLDTGYEEDIPNMYDFCSYGEMEK